MNVRLGIFDLKKEGGWHIDGPVYRIVVDTGTQQKALYWDERNPSNKVDSKMITTEFIQCWTALNRLAIGSRPRKSKPVKGRFVPPLHWFTDEELRSITPPPEKMPESDP